MTTRKKREKKDVQKEEAAKKERMQRKGQISQDTIEKQRISGLSNSDSPRNPKSIQVTKALNKTELSVGVKVVTTLADCLNAIGHPSRLKIVQYCLKPRRFTDIILDLRLNPASFKFHSKVLMDCDIIRRVERGLYETTKLGKLLLDLVNQASRLSN